MREEFEAWYADSVGLDALDIATWRIGEGYQNAYEHCAISWLAWQASRAMEMIELPTISISEYANRNGFNCADQALGGARKSITKVGLRVKP